MADVEATASESITNTDTLGAPYSSYGVVLSEPATMADTVTRSILVEKILSELATITGATVQAFHESLNESVSVIDDILKNLLYAVLVEQGIDVDDKWTLGYHEALLESVQVGELSSYLYGLLVSEGVTASDAASRQRKTLINISIALAFEDAVNHAYDGLLSESVSITDSIVSKALFYLDMLENVTIDANAEGRICFSLPASESLSIQDSPSVQAIFSEILSESASFLLSFGDDSSLYTASS